MILNRRYYTILILLCMYVSTIYSNRKVKNNDFTMAPMGKNNKHIIKQ